MISIVCMFLLLTVVIIISIVESQFINGGYALDLNLEITQILFENENFRISINDPTEFRTGVMQMMSAITKNRM